MDRDILFLVTSSFPYGKGEEFILNELDYLNEAFNSIHIISQNRDEKIDKQIDSRFMVHRIDKAKSLAYSQKLILLVKAVKELIVSKKIKITLTNLKVLYVYLLKSKLIENKILQIIDQEKYELDHVTLYSYWYDAASLAISTVKKKRVNVRTVSRAHRFDLYEEGTIQPFKNESIHYLDYILPCSKNGESYLKERFPNNADKIVCSYLGTLNENEFNVKSNSKTIISCSYLRPVKRVDLIINSLSLLNDKDIKWIHIGDGENQEYYKTLSKDKLKIQYQFLGHLSNSEVLSLFKNENIKCFINVSTSEGLPVSMMEAQSFGIPIIATNVGGVSEIVTERSGVLLDANPDEIEISRAIKKILMLDEVSYAAWLV